MKILLERLRLFIKSVPEEIDNGEKIVKVVFNPLNINAKGEVKPNTFRVNTDDLSVNRLDYTTLNFCKRQGVQLEAKSKPAMKDKNFYGIALLFAQEVRSLANVVYKPIRKPIKHTNKAHAEIIIGFNKKMDAGQVSSAQYNLITDELAKKARLYTDKKENLKVWESENATEILNLKL